MIGYKVVFNENNEKFSIQLEIPDDAQSNIKRKTVIDFDNAYFITDKAIVKNIDKLKGERRTSVTQIKSVKDGFVYRVSELIGGRIYFFANEVRAIDYETVKYKWINKDDKEGIELDNNQYSHGLLKQYNTEGECLIEIRVSNYQIVKFTDYRVDPKEYILKDGLIESSRYLLWQNKKKEDLGLFRLKQLL